MIVVDHEEIRLAMAAEQFLRWHIFFAG